MRNTNKLSVMVAQIGARMHYAVPRVLWRAQMLDRLMTDLIPLGRYRRYLQVMQKHLNDNAAIKRLLARAVGEVPSERICNSALFGVEYYLRCSRSRNADELLATYLWAGPTFCRRVKRRGFGNANLVYAFNSDAKELFEEAKRRGVKTVLEQTIAPKSIEYSLLAREYEAWPSWRGDRESWKLAQAFGAREQEEWKLADRIVCGSQFVADGLASCGISIERCTVVPYGVDVPFSQEARRADKRPLNVLFAGGIGVRKGFPYLLEAAKRLPRTRFAFRAAGTILVGDLVRRDIERHISLLGPIARNEMQEQYTWADVFVLPSICEGSATVCYEALASGLPVLTTPNAGSVVRDGIDGYVVPIRSSEAITTALEALHRRPEMRSGMSQSARERAKEFTVSNYGARLAQVLGTLDHTLSRCESFS